MTTNCDHCGREIRDDGMSYYEIRRYGKNAGEIKNDLTIDRYRWVFCSLDCMVNSYDSISRN